MDAKEYGLILLEHSTIRRTRKRRFFHENEHPRYSMSVQALRGLLSRQA